MRKIVFVTPGDTSAGFALAGVRQLSTPPEQLAGILADATTDPTTGLLAVDERLLDRATQQQLEDIERREPVAVVVLPAPAAATKLIEDYALRLIRRAIGYQVRVNV